jgi:hypothetical protein
VRFLPFFAAARQLAGEQRRCAPEQKALQPLRYRTCTMNKLIATVIASTFSLGAFAQAAAPATPAMPAVAPAVVGKPAAAPMTAAPAAAKTEGASTDAAKKDMPAKKHKAKAKAKKAKAAAKKEA